MSAPRPRASLPAENPDRTTADSHDQVTTVDVEAPRVRFAPATLFMWVSDLFGDGWSSLRRGKDFLPFLLAYAAFIFLFVAQYMATGGLFGRDPGLYMFTAHLWVTGSSSIYSYAYPLIPAVYVPVVLMVHNALLAFQISEVISALLLIAVFASSFVLFRRDTKSLVGGLVGASIIGISPLFVQEMTWGGQAQYAAFAFGFLAVASLRTWKASPSLRMGLSVGVLLSLALLSEGWAATYFVVLVGFYLLIAYQTALFRLPTFKAAGVAAVPPALVYVFLSLEKGGNVANGLSTPLILELGNTQLWTFLGQRIVLGNPFLEFGYVFLAVAYLACWGVFRGRIGKAPPLLLASLAALGVQVLVLSSLYFGDRPVYFALIPIGILASRTGSQLVPAVRRSIQRSLTGSHPLPSKVRWRAVRNSNLQAALASGVVLLIGFQCAVVTVTLPPSFTYYDTPVPLYEELSTLQQQPGNFVFLAEDLGTFPILYAEGHTVYPMVQPNTFTSNAQKEAAITATDVAYGTRWIDGGNLVLTDDGGQGSQPTPALFAYIYPFNLETAYLSDALLPVSFSPISNSSIVYHESPFYAPDITTEETPGGSLVDTYSFSTLTITKTMTLIPGGGASIHLEYDFNRSFPRSIELRIFSAAHLATGSFATSGNLSTGQMDYVYDTTTTDIDVDTSLSASVSAGKLSTQFIPSDDYGIPESDFTLNFTGNSLRYVNITLGLDTLGAQVVAPHVETEAQFFNSSNVRWIVADSSVGNIVAKRLAADPYLFTYDSTASFVIYEVRCSRATRNRD